MPVPYLSPQCGPGPMNSDNDPKEWKLGVDFGTTMSAVAFYLVSDSTALVENGRIYPIRQYPSMTSNTKTNLASHMYRTSCEVPSQLRYEHDHRQRWGYMAEHLLQSRGNGIPGHHLERFKLLLDYSEDTEEARCEVKEALRALPGNQSSVAVISDYLTHLFKHVLRQISNYGYEKHDKVELICTVPAIWKQSGNRQMIKAVLNAGERSGFAFGKDIYLVSEPEAAAKYVLASYPNTQLASGEAFVVVDAGGGTVDVITYLVVDTALLRLKEAVKGKGSLCGSSYLNEKFREQMEQRLGDLRDFHSGPGLTVSEIIDSAMRQFEHEIKPGFSGTEEVYHSIMIPRLKANVEKDFSPDELQVTSAHLEAIFRPVLVQLCELILSQIEEAKKAKHKIKKLFLVGGFSNSPYLRRYIEEECRAEALRSGQVPIVLVWPEAPEIAIASGAIWRALDKRNGPERISRSSIGICQHEEYNSKFKQHRGAEQVRDKIDGKDEVLSPSGFKIAHKQHRTISVNEEHLVLAVRLYASDENIADHYPITDLKNKYSDLLEEVLFPFSADQLKRLKECLPRTSKKISRNPTRNAGRGTNQPIRKSSRKRKPTAKVVVSSNPTPSAKQNPNGKGDQQQLLSPSRGRPQDSSDNSEDRAQHVIQLAELLEEASSPSGTTLPLEELFDHVDIEDDSDQYIRIDYTFIIEASGLLLTYYLECPIGDEVHRVKGDVNLAQIFDPGTA
ncbi:hypothetical protein MMC13_003493 [Lambiella insularis]|nr:hypothetical protein [Lambiella insularis]